MYDIMKDEIKNEMEHKCIGELLEKTTLNIICDGETAMRMPLTMLPCGVTGFSLSIFPWGIYIDCGRLPMAAKYGEFKELTIKIIVEGPSRTGVTETLAGGDRAEDGNEEK